MAHRITSDRLLTFDDYERLPQDPAFRDELSRGRLVREPRPGYRHGRVQTAIASAIHRWAIEHRLGEVVVESGFKLEHDPDTLRGPDVAFVSHERLRGDRPARWPDFPPDLVVEVLSPSDTFAGMAEKVAQYFHAGTRLVWLIDPEEEVAIVYRNASEVHVLYANEELDGEDVLPGFRCAIRDIVS